MPLMSLRVVVAAATIAVGACAAVAISKERASWLSRELAGRVAGTPTDCITLSQVEGPMIVDSRTILYRQGGKRVWRMDLGDSCPSLREDQILIVEPSDTRLCRNDRFTPIDRNSRIPGASCRVTGFTPYDRR